MADAVAGRKSEFSHIAVIYKRAARLAMVANVSIAEVLASEDATSDPAATYRRIWSVVEQGDSRGPVRSVISRTAWRNHVALARDEEKRLTNGVATGACVPCVADLHDRCLVTVGEGQDGEHPCWCSHHDYTDNEF